MVKSMQWLGAVVLLGSVALLGGCNGNDRAANGMANGAGPYHIDTAFVRNNWSPELDSLTQSYEMHRTMDRRAFDTNLRQIHDDAARALLTDRPLGLAPFVVPK